MWACEYVFDGTDTDGTEWYMCKVHGQLAIGDDWPCAGHYPPPYGDEPVSPERALAEDQEALYLITPEEPS